MARVRLKLRPRVGGAVGVWVWVRKGGARWGFSTGHTVGAAGGSAFDVFFFFNQEREGGCLVDCLLTGFLTMMMCFATIDRLEPLRRG